MAKINLYAYEVVIKKGPITLINKKLTSDPGQGYLTDQRFMLYQQTQLGAILFGLLYLIFAKGKLVLEVPLSSIKGIYIGKYRRNKLVFVIQNISGQEYQLKIKKFDEWLEAFREALAFNLYCELVPVGDNQWTVQRLRKATSASDTATFNGDRNNDKIWAAIYIRRQYNNLSRYAIDQHLINLGYNSAAIEEAWRDAEFSEAQARKLAAEQSRPLGKATIFGKFLLLQIPNMLSILAIGLLLVGIYLNLTQAPYWKFRTNCSLLVLIISIPILIVAAIILISLILHRTFSFTPKQLPLLCLLGLIFVCFSLAVFWQSSFSNYHDNGNLKLDNGYTYHLTTFNSENRKIIEGRYQEAVPGRVFRCRSGIFSCEEISQIELLPQYRPEEVKLGFRGGKLFALNSLVKTNNRDNQDIIACDLCP